jgi:thiosulfate/3-mercaptopyruvate sulfurtransferase
MITGYFSANCLFSVARSWDTGDMKICLEFLLLLVLAAGTVAPGVARSEPGKKEEIPTLSPEELVKILGGAREQKPLILNVGPRLLYQQAHIPGAEYIGAGGDPNGIESLRARVQALPHSTFIVLYCGCCPWRHCPNVHPAYSALRSMGFSQVKVLYIAGNFGTDWVDKGYPTVRGQ